MADIEKVRVLIERLLDENKYRDHTMEQILKNQPEKDIVPRDILETMIDHIIARSIKAFTKIIAEKFTNEEIDQISEILNQPVMQKIINNWLEIMKEYLAEGELIGLDEVGHSLKEIENRGLL